MKTKTKTNTRTTTKNYNTLSITKSVHAKTKKWARKRDMSLRTYTEEALKAYSKTN
jgi:predicted HicB family RNase H-like nuclease